MTNAHAHGVAGKYMHDLSLFETLDNWRRLHGMSAHGLDLVETGWRAPFSVADRNEAAFIARR